MLKNTTIPESGYVHGSLSYRGKGLALGIHTVVVTSFVSLFHSESDCHGFLHTEKFLTFKRNISRTIRGIFRWSMVFVSFSSALSSQTNLLFCVNLPFKRHRPIAQRPLNKESWRFCHDFSANIVFMSNRMILPTPVKTIWRAFAAM